VRQDVARTGGAAGIQSLAAFVDVLNDPFLVDYESGAISKLLIFVKDPIVLHDRAFEIAE
jgi:hypothetical protein